ncbi:MAG: hypothetical protein ACYC5R_09410 [Melioribacteraceae bacterium]
MVKIVLSKEPVKLNQDRIKGTITIKQKEVIHPNFFNRNRINIRYGERNRIQIFKIRNPILENNEMEIKR